ncbi:MAG: hypothetical protein R3E73_14690 [Porticoccaceae bacterium]
MAVGRSENLYHQRKNKFKLLRNVLAGDNVESVIVFASRRDQCRRLQEKLQKMGFNAGLLSGDVP